jgi:hypothetical protein
MAQLWKVRLPNGNILTPGDWTAAEPLYSTVEVAAGPFPLLTGFSYSRGGTVPGSPGPRDALLTDTNLQGEGNRLPENEELICFNLQISVFKIGPAANVDQFPDADQPGVPLPDMLRLQRDLLVEFKIAAVKDYTQSPIGYFPAGMGVSAHYSGGRSKVSGGAPTGEVIAYNGSPSRYDVRQFASPMYVAGGESFVVDIRPARGEVMNLNLVPPSEGGTSRMRMRIYADGYRRRPVA